MRQIQRVISYLKQLWASAVLHRRVFYIVGGMLIMVVIVVQLFWPAGRARPFLVVSNIAMGAATARDVTQKLKTLTESANLELQLGDKTYTEKLVNIGVDVDNQLTAKNVLAYPLWQRFIPFSLFGNTLHHPKVITVVDTQNTLQHAKDWSADAYIVPTNATIAINGTNVAAVSDKDGTEYKPDDIQHELQKLVLAQGIQKRKVGGKAVKPQRDDKAIKATIAQAQTAIDTPLTLKILDTNVNVSKEEKATWLTFTESADAKSLSLDIKKDVLQKYLAQYEKQVYIAPGTTAITIVDGKETARVEGTKGRGLDIEKTINLTKTQLQKPAAQPLVLAISELSPKISYSRSYSKTSAGLTALLADIAKSKGDYAITVQELGGLGRYGSYNGGKTYHPASTYKLFVAYSVLLRIDAGTWHWGDSYYNNGNTIESCFNAMIIRSDNACAEAFGTGISWQTIQNEIRAIGINSTIMIAGKKLSTTNDQVTFLRKLLYDDIVSADSQNRLLSAMRQQIYRAGVPSGVKATVADKVGFLDGLLHDSAIVYSSHGTYLISIYTNGSSWSNIADATRQIESYLKG